MHVQILMCTCNGARFLPEQLRSIAEQDHADWSLWVSDDNSQDETRDIVKAFAATVSQDVHLVDGPGKGAAANFLSLLNHRDLKACPAALCDQDDVWLPDKLSRVVEVLEGRPDGAPATLICGPTYVVGEDLQLLRISANRRRRPEFRNALVESIAGGNTMVLDPALLDLVRQTGADLDVPFHDWWLYLLATGVGADVIYLDDPLVKYRQHGANQRGDRVGLKPKLRRLVELIDGSYPRWVVQNLTALQSLDLNQSDEARLTVARLLNRESGSWARLFQRLSVVPRLRRDAHFESILVNAALLVPVGLMAGASGDVADETAASPSSGIQENS